MIVIYLYNRLFDPLIQGNFWLYIRDLLDQPLPGVRLHVVTYEDPRFPITSRQSSRSTTGSNRVSVGLHSPGIQARA